VSLRHAEIGVVTPEARILVMSGERTSPSPLNVGANTAVFLGIGNFENASREAPDSVWSM